MNISCKILVRCKFDESTGGMSSTDHIEYIRRSTATAKNTKKNLNIHCSYSFFHHQFIM